MDEAAFLKSKYARQLVLDADKHEAELKEFNTSWQKFWKRNADDLGTVLICHLAVEHYLDEWLAAANPATKPTGKTRLTFAQKIDHADGADSLIQPLMPGLKLLNRIRNELAHDLTTQISDKRLEPFRLIVWTWHKAAGRPCNNGIALVKDFALLASGLLSSHAYAIRRYGKGVGLIAYRRWLRSALRTECKT
jgi:hypothetical protein